jgi:hypothetical protein
MPDPISVAPDELTLTLRLWIRAAPKWIWKRDLDYERARAEKRHDPSREPDPQGDLAAYLADRFVRTGWMVQHVPLKTPGDRIVEGPARQQPGKK